MSLYFDCAIKSDGGKIYSQKILYKQICFVSPGGPKLRANDSSINLIVKYIILQQKKSSKKLLKIYEYTFEKRIWKYSRKLKLAW